MIIYSLETSLGNYVLNSNLEENLSESTSEIISARIADNSHNENKENIAQLVEASYLDEVFNLAIDMTKGTSFESKMKALKQFCLSLNIFDIRNAISHPNRPFPDSFWFRSAAIASDPLILQLGLGEVRQALNAAIEEKLNTPPDEWLNNVKWAIPNTLPTTFDHEITGLIGREKEYKDLDNTLGKPRVNLIAIVAPGGVGKTALTLQFLKDISLDPKWSENINSILFCTLKNERLTPDGIEKIEAIDGIHQIRDSLLEDIKSIYLDKEINSFEEACSKLANEKILICIDNLETLLVHSQQEFVEFNESLPLPWKVLVTSRITLDSATAVPIQPLGKRHAINLCRNYFKRKGVSNFSQETLELIATKASYNPLAIRLTVDLYLRGIDISESMHQSKKDIAAFSYNNLIESLNKYSIWILEAIFVSDEVNKSQLIELLDLSNDEISESINELSRTSLIIRSTSETGNDLFQLSDSIKDLLLVNPINIDVRNKISARVKERKNKIQEQHKRNQILGINKFDVEFISQNALDSVVALVVDLNKVLSRPYAKRNHSDLVDIKNRFGELIAYNSSNHELLFHYSRILKSLGDEQGQSKVIHEALKHDPENPRYLLAQALFLFHKRNCEEANLIFESLLKKGLGLPENSSRKFASSLVKLHYLSLIQIGDYTAILEKTTDWKNDANWSVMMGNSRATALKRSVELDRHDFDKKCSAYNNVLDIYDHLFKNDSYPYIVCNEAMKFLKDQSNLKVPPFTPEFAYKFTEFVAKHFFNIVNAIKGQSIDSYDNNSFLNRISSISFETKTNPVLESDWFTSTREISYDKEHIAELKDDGYLIVRVTNIPENNYGLSSFIFAKDKDNNDFFLHVDNFESGWTKWGYLALHSKLAIKHNGLDSTKATVASEIVEIDQVEI